MNNLVSIKVTGTQNYDGEKDSITTIADGKYFFKNDKHYFLYEEATESGNLKTTIKVSDEAMEVKKTGAMHIHLFFEAGREIACNYDTPYGSIPVAINTKRLDMFIENERIKIIVDYEIKNHDQVMAYSQLVVEAK